jgi:hypothetical protein
MTPPVEQWVWVSDFHGFGFSDLNPQIATTFLELSARHYPERLGAFLVVGAPFIFSGLWSVVQPLVDPVTRKKIHMLSWVPTPLPRPSCLLRDLIATSAFASSSLKACSLPR